MPQFSCEPNVVDFVNYLYDLIHYSLVYPSTEPDHKECVSQYKASPKLYCQYNVMYIGNNFL